MNIAKTNHVLFRPDKKMKMIDHDDITKYDLMFGNESLVQKERVKFLGVMLDVNMNWTPHCKAICSRLSSAMFVLRNVKNVLPTNAMKTLYYSLFYSHMQYGIMLYGNSAFKYLTNHIIILQKKAIRLVKNVGYNSHTPPIFKELSILKFDDAVKAEHIKFMYKYENNMLPVNLNSLLKRCNEIHNYDTRYSKDPLSIKHNFAPLEASFLVKGPTLWKIVKRDEKNIKKISTFIATQKKHIINSY